MNNNTNNNNNDDDCCHYYYRNFRRVPFPCLAVTLPGSGNNSMKCDGDDVGCGFSRTKHRSFTVEEQFQSILQTVSIFYERLKVFPFPLSVPFSLSG